MLFLIENLKETKKVKKESKCQKREQILCNQFY